MIWIVAIIVPTALAVAAAWPLWRRRNTSVGNAVGALVAFSAGLVFLGRESVLYSRALERCVRGLEPCPPRGGVQFLYWVCVIFADVIAFFTIGLLLEERVRRRSHYTDWD